MLAREVGAPKNAIRRPSMHLLVAAKSPSQASHLPQPPHRIELRKTSMFNGINRHYGAGRRVGFGGARDLEGGHIS
jgi:hypothetical protein